MGLLVTPQISLPMDTIWTPDLTGRRLTNLFINISFHFNSFPIAQERHLEPRARHDRGRYHQTLESSDTATTEKIASFIVLASAAKSK